MTKPSSRPLVPFRILLRLLKEFIIFAEKDEEVQKVILRQHQTTGVDCVVKRALVTAVR
jgi:type I site-specific restriction-modification system R (restriction) subunit